MGVISFINDGYPNPGIYKGINNRNVTICDNLKNRIVRRESVFGKGKHDGLQEMGEFISLNHTSFLCQYFFSKCNRHETL